MSAYSRHFAELWRPDRALAFADRPTVVEADVSLFALEGAPRIVGAAAAELAGIALAPGGVSLRGQTWWCRASDSQVVVIGDAAHAGLLRGRLAFQGRDRRGLRVRELGSDHAAIQIGGPRTGELLAALGVYGPSGDPRDVAPAHHHPIAWTEAFWLLRGAGDALVIVGRRELPRVWAALSDAGRLLPS